MNFLVISGILFLVAYLILRISSSYLTKSINKLNVVTQRIASGDSVSYTHLDVYKRQGFLHAKMVLCDQRIATVGTINFDYRSLYLHFECNVLLTQKQTI